MTKYLIELNQEEIRDVAGMMIIPSIENELTCLTLTMFEIKHGSIMDCFKPTAMEKEIMQTCPMCM